MSNLFQTANRQNDDGTRLARCLAIAFLLVLLMQLCIDILIWVRLGVSTPLLSVPLAQLTILCSPFLAYFRIAPSEHLGAFLCKVLSAFMHSRPVLSASSSSVLRL